MDFYTNPWFWAAVSMLGLQAATLVVSGHRIGHNLVFVTVTLTLVTVGRALLVLPFCPQPRFDLGSWNWIVGGLVMLLALAVAMPTMSVKWWRAPRAGMRLRTGGAYSIVRHPMYLAELLWPIGWSTVWGSRLGLALTPLWWAGLLIHVLTEEARLQQQLGPEYEQYMRKVRGRMLPGLPL